ncbi:hypothetical protein ABH19_06605 [Leptospirillum sp. Group II 'CF-1']|jgi:hypothetical protein|nr:hypothetical protein ABH19_06605 [Leptospirillum sp. Group II 'CF-1']
MRINTYLESQGAEFLVLGMLLARGIEAYKTYANMKGYDLLAIGNGNGKSLKIQVKSRARIGATDFPAKNLGDCDIVCVVVLNIDKLLIQNRQHPRSPQPEYYLIPKSEIIKKANSSPSITNFQNFVSRKRIGFFRKVDICL